MYNTEPLLTIEGVQRHFGATIALKGVDLSLQPGRVYGLIGANGAGKSTLINIITGVTRPSAGKMTLGGSPYTPQEPRDARDLGIYAVQQELAIFPHLSVVENIYAGSLKTNGVVLDRSKMRQNAAAALANLGHRIPLDTLAGDLSTSHQQIVEITRATVNGARVLLLDEPTSSLTIADCEQLFTLIRRLKAQGCCVIFISHFLSDVMKIADEVMVLRDGGVVLHEDTKNTNLPALSLAMFGRVIAKAERKPSQLTLTASTSAALLTLDSLATQGVPWASLTVRPGEIVGIFGLMDCGATELLEAIFGLRPATGGLVSLANFHGRSFKPWRSGSIGMVPEERRAGLATDRTIAENVLAPDWRRVLKLGLINPGKVGTLVSEYVTRFGIKCQGPNQTLGALSGGNQQKAALARFANVDVSVILLDEPTRGVDMAARAELWDYIRTLAASGKGVLFATSDPEEALALSNWVVVMRRGHLLGKQLAADVDPEMLMVLATQEEDEVEGRMQ